MTSNPCDKSQVFVPFYLLFVARSRFIAGFATLLPAFIVRLFFDCVPAQVTKKCLRSPPTKVLVTVLLCGYIEIPAAHNFGVEFFELVLRPQRGINSCRCSRNAVSREFFFVKFSPR